jgi:thymidylate synthase ThyX
MAFSAKILADSVAPSGKRLTTFEVTYPRCIHSEIMTHRILSKNSASSRAIPTEKLIARVLEDPFIPLHWGKNQKGMQAGEELAPAHQALVRAEWLRARDNAVETARRLVDQGLHKQIANRVIEPWMWITIIISGTEWTNFFGLRCHKDAEPHFQKIAGMMKELYDGSEPRKLVVGEWHLPLVDVDEDDTAALDEYRRPFLDTPRARDVTGIRRKVSVGRCARVSYLTHDGRRDLTEDIGLHDRLKDANPGHWSPFEHVAQAESDPKHRSGNFFGWMQYRKTFEQEHIGGRMP